MADQGDESRIRKIVEQAQSLSDVELTQLLERECGSEAQLRAEVLRRLQESKSGKSQESVSLSADRNLMVGIIALQMGFVDRDSLIECMNAWALEKSRPLEAVLVDHEKLDRETAHLLSQLVNKHLEDHGADAKNSLRSLGVAESVKSALKSVADSGVQASLLQLTEHQSGIGHNSTVAFHDREPIGTRFRVLRPHASGGLGMVSVALDEELNREVALKEVQHSYSLKVAAQDRLRVEAEITGGLEHPGIVPVYGLGAYEDGRPFYCMRFIRGDSLKEVIEVFHRTKGRMEPSNRNLQLRNLLRRFIDVCDAISYAHNRKVLHRDLKPGNIMLGKFGETLVVDWGLAKATADPQRFPEASETPIMPRSGSTAAPTVDGSAIGTPEYMSPEQAEGKIDQLGPATDIYSLGATLYCLLVGKAPVTGNSVEEKISNARRNQFRKPRELDASIPRPLQAICLKAMARNPNDRYVGPAELASDIERWLADEPVLAYREPWHQSAMRFFRKNRAASLALAVGTLVAILGLSAVGLVTHAKNLRIAAQNREIIAKNLDIDRKNEEIAARSVALSEANEDLKRSRDTLAENYRIFRTTSRRLINKAEGELSQIPGMEQLRADITKQAIDLFEPFVTASSEDLSPATDQLSRVFLAQLHCIYGNLKRNHGDYPAALENNQKSVALMRTMLAEDEDDPISLGNLSDFLQDLATTKYVSGDIDGSLADIDESVEMSGALLARYSDSQNVKRLHAENCFEAASMYKNQQRLDESNRLFDTYFENVTVPTNVEARGFALYLLAVVETADNYRMLKRYEEARSWALRAEKETAEALESTSVRRLRNVQARSLLQLTHIDLGVDTLELDTLARISKAEAIWASLSEDFPDFSAYRKYLALALNANARCLARMGEQERAREKFLESRQAVQALVESHLTDVNLAIAFEVFTEEAAFEYHNNQLPSSLEAKERAADCLRQLEERGTRNLITEVLIEKFNSVDSQPR